jgi:hypothetical protein
MRQRRDGNSPFDDDDFGLILRRHLNDSSGFSCELCFTIMDTICYGLGFWMFWLQIIMSFSSAIISL